MAPYFMSSKQFINEKSFLYGAFLAILAYGVVATIAVICLNLLVRKRIPIRYRWFQFAYVILLFTLSSLSMGLQLEITQAGFIDHREFAGGTAGYPGPAAYLWKNFDNALPSEFKGWMACLVITNWFSDALLLWRCMVLYQDNRFWPKFFNFLPACLLTTSFVSGILHLIQITAPTTSVWSTTNLPFNFTILYAIIALLFNVTLTGMIAIRLFLLRRHAVKALGPGHGSEYTSVIAMLIESAFLIDVFIIAFLIPYALDNWFCSMVIQPLVQIQAMAPLLIIYRVVQGKAWVSSTQGAQHQPSFESSRRGLSFGPTTGMYGHHHRTSSQVPIISASHTDSSSISKSTEVDIELGRRLSESSYYSPYHDLPKSMPSAKLESSTFGGKIGPGAVESLASDESGRQWI